jgi:Flp pilus assembly protein CpaB
LLLAVLAFGGVFLLGNTLGGGGVGGAATTTVVVAKQAIPLRHTITTDDLETAKVSGAFTSSNNTYTNPSDVKGLIAEIQISKGSVITADMLARDINLVPTGSAPAYLPLASGYVALTIPTGEQQGVAGHISVGDYITVITSLTSTLINTQTGSTVGVPKVITKTVFTNIHIIGLGPAAANVQPAGGAATVGGTQTQSGVTSSLTIELTQCDAEFFTWFLNNTTGMKYTLESFKDYLAQPPSTPDPTCPTVISAQGVSQKEVEARYHFSAL